MNNIFKQTDIGLIPDDWEVIKLNSLLLETNTRNPSKVHAQKMIKYVDVTSVSNELFNISDCQYIRGIDAPGRARKVIYTNDVIFATIRPTLKRIAKVTLNFNDEYCSTAFCVVRTNDKMLYHNFIYHYFLTDSFIQEIAKHQYGASYPAVRDEDVKNIKIPLPPLQEQKKIADILSKIQQAIETQKQIIKTTQELKKALMQKLFTEGLNGEPQKMTEIGLIPESWEVVELGRIVSRPIKDGVHQTPKYVTDGIPFITAKDLINEEISFSNCKYISIEEHEKLFQKVNPEKDDVLLTKVGTIGNVAIVRDEKPFSIFVQVALIKPNRDSVNPLYLKYCLLSDKIQSEILRTSGRSTMKFIGVQKISKLSIPLAPLPIQKVISSHLELLTDKIKFEIIKNESLKKLFKTSLNELMTGQTRVKDIELEKVFSRDGV